MSTGRRMKSSGTRRKVSQSWMCWSSRPVRMPPKTAKRREGKAWLRKVNTDDDGGAQVLFLEARFYLEALAVL
jgi:hypothetical protein